jgi:DNA replication initiation complex subunit (GINS family)
MYDLLYKAWLKEKENEELQDLSEDFYAKFVEYIQHIRQEGRMLDRKSAKARLIAKEQENVKRLMRELSTLRFNKIVDYVVSSKPLRKETLAVEETTILLGLRPYFEDFQLFLKNSLRGKPSKIIKKGGNSSKKKLLRFLHEVPAVVGADLMIYGPFSIEDVGTLPDENAKVLVKQGVAIEIDTD